MRHYFSGLFARPPFDRLLKGRREWRSFRCECRDLKRHFLANKRVLEAIIYYNGNVKENLKIRSTHLTKLSLFTGSEKFDHDLYQCMPASKVKIINQHKLLMRNIEIDIAEGLKIYDKETDKSLNDYIIFLIGRFDAACDNIDRTLDNKNFRQMPIKLIYREKNELQKIETAADQP